MSVWVAVQESRLGHPERKNTHEKARTSLLWQKQTSPWACKEQKIAGRGVGECEHRAVSQLTHRNESPLGCFQLGFRAAITKVHLFVQEIFTEGPCVPRQCSRCLGVNQWGEDQDWGLPWWGHSAWHPRVLAGTYSQKVLSATQNSEWKETESLGAWGEVCWGVEGGREQCQTVWSPHWSLFDKTKTHWNCFWMVTSPDYQSNRWLSEVTHMEHALDTLWTALRDKCLPPEHIHTPPWRWQLKTCCAHYSIIHLHLSDHLSFFFIKNKKGSGSERLSKLLDIPGQ